MNKLINFMAGVLLALLFMPVELAAHALWIHTSSSGRIGLPHEFTIQYADYEEGAIEKVDDWYSDVSGFELYLVSPSGKRTKLPYHKGEDYAKGSFVPEERGTYRLEINHSSKTDPGKTIYQFNAVAYVQVGKKTILPDLQEGPDLMFVPGKTTGEYQVLFQGSPLSENEVVLLNPEGKTETIQTDELGRFKLTKPDKGKYFLESSTYVKFEKEDASGYEGIWRCITQVLD